MAHRADRREIMRALSLLQPWAWLIIQPDPERPHYPLKDIENRTWDLPKSFELPQRIYVHASLRYDISNFQDREIPVAESDIVIPSKADLAYGAIIGEVTIMGSTTLPWPYNPWFDGPYGFELMYPRPYDTPILCRGQLKFWTPPQEIMEPRYVLIDFDECECGDYRHDHDLETGRCRMPDNIAHGMQPCLGFKLTRAALEIPEPFRSR